MKRRAWSMEEGDCPTRYLVDHVIDLLPTALGRTGTHETVDDAFENVGTFKSTPAFVQEMMFLNANSNRLPEEPDQIIRVATSLAIAYLIEAEKLGLPENVPQGFASLAEAFFLVGVAHGQLLSEPMPRRFTSVGHRFY